MRENLIIGAPRKLLTVALDSRRHVAALGDEDEGLPNLEHKQEIGGEQGER